MNKTLILIGNLYLAVIVVEVRNFPIMLAAYSVHGLTVSSGAGKRERERTAADPEDKESQGCFG
jgi:hypothetical protein